MFIRRTQTRNRTSGEPYSTYRLVEASRVGGAVKQTTLLNLGSHFALPKDESPPLARRIDAMLQGQSPLVDATMSETGHPLAHPYTCHLTALAAAGAGILALE